MYVKKVCQKGNEIKKNMYFLGIVGELLKDNQPKLYQQDMKHGGTPIHWAISREVIEALADKNCDINAQNFDGRTALHVMVLRGRLECTIALLSRGNYLMGAAENLHRLS